MATFEARISISEYSLVGGYEVAAKISARCARGPLLRKHRKTIGKIIRVYDYAAGQMPIIRASITTSGPEKPCIHGKCDLLSRLKFNSCLLSSTSIASRVNRPDRLSRRTCSAQLGNCNPCKSLEYV